MTTNKVDLTNPALKDMIIVSPETDGLRVVKYSNKAFFLSAWDTIPDLREYRGLVIDADNNIVAYPFTKVHNINEHGIEETKEEHFKGKTYQFVEKKNGFLAVVSKHNNKLIVSTTGNVVSPYVSLARHWVNTIPNIDKFDFKNRTLTFEVVDTEVDPHIIFEGDGIYLIGCRENYLGSTQMSEDELDVLAKELGVKRPSHFISQFDNVLADAMDSSKFQKEGYMIRDIATGTTVAKIKGAYYSTIKQLARLGKTRADQLWDPAHSILSRDPALCASLVNGITSNFDKDTWALLPSEIKAIFLNKVAVDPSYKIDWTSPVNVIFLRGVPGSGKSTLVNEMIGCMNVPVVQCEADMSLNKYVYEVFDNRILNQCHINCKRTFINAIVDRARFVIVSNVNREYSHFSEMVNIAKVMNCKVDILIKEKNHDSVNVHGVTDTKIDSIVSQFEINIDGKGIKRLQPKGY